MKGDDELASPVGVRHLLHKEGRCKKFAEPDVTRDEMLGYAERV